MKDVLLTFALEQESQNLFDDYSVLYTGVGKVNAAWKLAQYIHKNRPSAVINLGTAGSTVFQARSVVHCAKFIQRDMDAISLGFSKWQTPFSDQPVLLEYGQAVKGIPHAICGTGDTFETAHSDSDYNVVDMEAYVLALICRDLDIPFTCLKYISDGADQSAGSDWEPALKETAYALQEALELTLQ